MELNKLSNTQFADLPLAPELLKGIAEAGFEYCTPIQAATLPLTLSGRDVAGQAQTGTGKTAAFLITVFQRLLEKQHKNREIRAFILAPTRELAIQIHKDAEMIGKYCGFQYALIYGGTGYQSQQQTLRSDVDIIIGTPGRLIDYFKQGIFHLKHVEVAVLDEADRMFDLGFIKEVRFLLRRMPKPDQRLNLMFSATLNYRVTELAYELMNDPQWIKLSTGGMAENIEEVVYYVANEQKIPLLLGLLRHGQWPRCMVFINTKHQAENVAAYLEANGFQGAVLSGDVPQKKRQSLLAQFKSGDFPVLVATDIAARGLHIPEVSHVINFDLPQDPEDYVHRVGRTARAGASGTAVSFACETYAFHLTDIEEFIGHKIPSQPIPEDLLIVPTPPPRRSHGPSRHSPGRKSSHSGGGSRPREGGKQRRRPG